MQSERKALRDPILNVTKKLSKRLVISSTISVILCSRAMAEGKFEIAYAFLAFLKAIRVDDFVHLDLPILFAPIVSFFRRHF
jgi:hypothetical protein